VLFSNFSDLKYFTQKCISITQQTRTTEEAMGRHHTARHEVSPIKRKKCIGLLVIDRIGEE